MHAGRSAALLSSQHDAHVRTARNSDRSPRPYVASRKGARSASEMKSCWLDKRGPCTLLNKIYKVYKIYKLVGALSAKIEIDHRSVRNILFKLS